MQPAELEALQVKETELETLVQAAELQVSLSQEVGLQALLSEAEVKVLQFLMVELGASQALAAEPGTLEAQVVAL